MTHKGKLTEYIKVACDDKAFVRGGPIVLTHLLQAVRKEGVDSFIQSLAIIIHIMNLCEALINSVWHIVSEVCHVLATVLGLGVK